MTDSRISSESPRLHDTSRQVEALLAEIKALASEDMFAKVTDLLQGVLELHRVALSKMLELGTDAPSQATLAARACEDELVASLLLLHGLHPLTALERVAKALDSVRPYLASHSGDVEVVSLDDLGNLKLRLSGTCRSCASSGQTIDRLLRQAVEDAAPEICSIEVDSGDGAAPREKLVQIDLSHSRRKDDTSSAALRCDICAAELPDTHRHVVELIERQVRCACAACALLFQASTAQKYRTIPDRVLYDPQERLSEADWATLEIPVRLSFVFYHSKLSRWVAIYPSPAGPLESALPLEGLARLAEKSPLFGGAAPDVEAVLVYGKRFSPTTGYLLVPIDACYELVGIIRRLWRGIDGGSEVWSEIDLAVERLRSRKKPVVSGAAREVSA